MKFIGKILSSKATGGCLLLLATLAALLAENSGTKELYHQFLHFDIGLVIGHDHSLLHLDTHELINDLLMAVFFLLVGIEIKREMVGGQLSSLSAIATPGMAALAGMAVPAAIYCLFNWGNTVALNGWAIPSATDIAFAIGVLALLGKRVPYQLKLFLLTVAVLDDLGAIVVIAVFYSSGLRFDMLGYSALIMAALILFNWLGVYRRSPYVVLGVLLWYCVLNSGIHATIAGVLLAFALPTRVDIQKRKFNAMGIVLNNYYSQLSPAERMENSLSGWVTFFILPLFAFTNAGVPLGNMGMSSVGGVTLGVALGLLVGKTLGIFTACLVMFKVGVAKLPEGCAVRDYFGVAILCGIGFTMSLFVTGLSFSDEGIINQARLGILVGSSLAAVFGYTYLRFVLAKPLPIPEPIPEPELVKPS